MSKLTISDWAKLRVIRDGGDYAIVGPDFESLRTSPVFWINPGGYYFEKVHGNYGILNQGVGYLPMETIEIIIDYLNKRQSVADKLRDELQVLREGFDPEDPPDNNRDVIVQLRNDENYGMPVVAEYSHGVWYQLYPRNAMHGPSEIKRWWNMPGNEGAC